MVGEEDGAGLKEVAEGFSTVGVTPPAEGAAVGSAPTPGAPDSVPAISEGPAAPVVGAIDVMNVDGSTGLDDWPPGAAPGGAPRTSDGLGPVTGTAADSSTSAELTRDSATGGFPLTLVAPGPGAPPLAPSTLGKVGAGAETGGGTPSSAESGPGPSTGRSGSLFPWGNGAEESPLSESPSEDAASLAPATNDVG